MAATADHDDDAELTGSRSFRTCGRQAHGVQRNGWSRHARFADWSPGFVSTARRDWCRDTERSPATAVSTREPPTGRCRSSVTATPISGRRWPARSSGNVTAFGWPRNGQEADDGCWPGFRGGNAPKVYQPRARRACLGELIQIDGSDHRWFEERAPACTLLVYVDDATSRLMMLHFTQTESTFSYFEATRAYIERHGKPGAFTATRPACFAT